VVLSESNAFKNSSSVKYVSNFVISRFFFCAMTCSNVSARSGDIGPNEGGEVVGDGCGGFGNGFGGTVDAVDDDLALGGLGGCDEVDVDGCDDEDSLVGGGGDNVGMEPGGAVWRLTRLPLIRLKTDRASGNSDWGVVAGVGNGGDGVDEGGDGNNEAEEEREVGSGGVATLAVEGGRGAVVVVEAFVICD